MTLLDTSRLADNGVRDEYSASEEVVMEGVKRDFMCSIGCGCGGSLGHGDSVRTFRVALQGKACCYARHWPQQDSLSGTCS